MPSSKRRTISNSGKSEKSRKTDTSKPAGSLSSTAPSSFEQVFGKGNPAQAEIVRAKGLLNAAEDRLGRLAQMEVPTIALLRTAHLQRLRREQRHIGQLRDYLRALQTK